MYVPLPYYEDKINEEEVDGLKWTMGEDLESPEGLAPNSKTKIKEEFVTTKFKTPLDSLLAFLPLSFWKFHLKETNRYAYDFLRENKRKKIYGMSFVKITIKELFTFYAILMQMSCRPSPGRPYTDCWRFQKEWFPTCQQMKVTRFKIIRKFLHWNNNDLFKVTKDSLYKVRAILNFMNASMGRFVDAGNSLALDETTCALKSSFAKSMIYFDKSKPKGKFHLKFYTLCENSYGNALVVRMCHRKYNYKSKPSSEDENEGNKIEKVQVKAAPGVNIRLIPDMCKHYSGTGRVVNMDRAYSSPKVLIKLLDNGIYARGTVMTNSQFLPSFVKFKKGTTYKRGTMKYAINKKYNMSMYAWNDKNPVHVVSTADATATNTVHRKQKDTYVEVPCPASIRKYNEEMGGIDRFNQLMSLFSLGKLLTFDRYYKKVAMVLMDFVLINAFLHWKVANKDKLSDIKRITFMETLIDQMINENIPNLMRRHEKQERQSANESKYNTDIEDDDDDASLVKEKDSNMINKLLSLGELHIPVIEEIEENTDSSQIESKCIPISIDHKFLISNKTNKSCKVCVFEGRNICRRVQFCGKHNIFLCTTKYQDASTSPVFVHNKKTW